MTIVFDEVTGSVTPNDAEPTREEPVEGSPGPTASAELDEVQMNAWMRRHAWLEARRLAD